MPAIPLSPGYQVKYESIQVGALAALQIRSLLDKQQFSDPEGLAAALGISSSQWSLFGQLWPSGLQLALALALRPVVDGEEILEIGCGLALASLVSHRRGASVTASDSHPLAAAFLLENLRLNELAPMRYCHGDWSTEPTPQAGPVRMPKVSGLFGLIMGSDVLYERDDGGALPAYIERHALPLCEVLIVDPDRGNRPAFSRRLHELGFELEETLIRDADYKGRLLRYTRHD